MIKGHERIREAYRDPRVAREYVDRRFREPLGAMLHDRQVAQVRAALRERAPQSVLEIAPGPGRLTVDVAPAARQIIVIDASGEMLQEARVALARAGCDNCLLVQGDAFQLPFRSSFDVIYTFRLIRHFAADDRARLYAQIAAVLRPGGLLMFDAVNAAVSPRAKGEPTAVAYTEHYDAELTPEEIREELRHAGFELLTLDPVHHRYPLLYQIQVLIAPRSRAVARAGMELVERLPGGRPLEWIVTCQRI